MNIKLSRPVKSFFLAIGSIAITAMVVVSVAFASSTDVLYGYTWSTSIGWVKMNNCDSPSNCPPGIGYGATIPLTGTTRPITGYGWSSNLGWVSFNSSATTSCPASVPVSTNCQARIEWGATGGSAVPVKGWARACSVFATGCSGALRPVSQNGGWDGYISLQDSNTADSVDYGVTLNTSTGVMSGFAWGDQVVGWVDFVGVSINAGLCPDGSPIQNGDITQCPNIVFCPTTTTPAPNGDIGQCEVVVVVCPWDGLPTVPGDISTCPTTHPCPTGPNLPTSQQCPNTTCPDLSTPINGICPDGNTCPDGSAPVGGVCPVTPSCQIGQPCWCVNNPGDTANCPVTPSCQIGQPCWCVNNPGDTANCPVSCSPGQPCWCVNNPGDTANCPGTGGPIPGQCSNIPDPIEISIGILPPPAFVVPPYQLLPNGRCVCAAGGYILNAKYLCVKPVYTEQ